MGATHLSGPLYVGGQVVPGFDYPRPGRTFYLAAGGNSGSDIPEGSDSYDGKSWDNPFLTLERFLDEVKTFDTLFFVGDVREEALIGSNLAFDVRIVGCGSLHHPDVPSSLYHPGASMIRPPASPTAATPLIELRGRGWQFYNIAFDCPVDAAAVKGVSNALSGTSEYDASHASFYGCTFQQGKYAFQDAGGLVNVSFIDCEFRIMSVASACAIINTSTAVRVPQFWKILGCRFPGNSQSGGNESHIDAPLSGSIIRDSIFGTVEGTGLYIDLTGGDDNNVYNNQLAGAYNTSDYVAGTNDIWYGNRCAVTAVTAPDGVSLAVPAP